MRLTVPSFRSKMIGVFQFLELWMDEHTLEEAGNKDEKKRRTLSKEVEKTASALTQMLSDEIERERERKSTLSK